LSGITTHVLDTALGHPAAGVPVTLERQISPGEWQLIGRGETDADGRLRTLTPDAPPLPGTYRLQFDTRRYFEPRGTRAFHAAVVVMFEVTAAESHYHVPLLLSPFGYTTYRGS